MVQRIMVILEDDLDGSKATETVQFGLDGVAYEVDVNDEHAARLRDVLAPWVRAARRVSGRKQQTRTSTRREDLNEIRVWARENGYEVSDRGRVAQTIVRAYDTARS